MFLDSFYLRRRKAHVLLIEEAIACGEPKSDTDPELLVDALHGCRDMGQWTNGLLGPSRIIGAFAQ